MAITREQALTLGTFHWPWKRTTDTEQQCAVWRRNGQTQTWKTRPDDFRVPVKWGLRRYGQITQAEAGAFYAPADCPACHGSKL